MGSCISYHFTREVIGFQPMAQVITIDGSLIEYSVPTNVSQVLDKEYSTSFLCNSDELYFDERIPELGYDHELVELGQIYFMLPRSMLDQPVTRDDMAALAVKACLAFVGALEKRESLTASEIEFCRYMTQDRLT
ncbi:hypothetical protein FCM35_KLT04573 [Carex littledalei]|uniref:Uncharacterized protein n=1 Tax=Carex littledalei TaxID=544730 RepID=A0A833R8Q4_9POAL|nr:hypothetical protein FCM35_KLT04573 [Carex littledalei]